MIGHDHLIERRRADARQPQRWEVLTHAGMVRAVVYTETDAHRIKAALDGAAEARRIYLDLDGVMADFDGSFPDVFGLDHRDLADDEMWGRINGHPSFFRDLPPMAGAVEFFRSIEHLQPIILTACPKSNYAHVARQKREWVREHLSDRVHVLPVMGGRNKPLFMHAPGDILIDDYRRNTEAWAEAGGFAILHRGFDRTGAMLQHVLAYGRFPIEITNAAEAEEVA